MRRYIKYLNLQIILMHKFNFKRDTIKRLNIIDHFIFLILYPYSRHITR